MHDDLTPTIVARLRIGDPDAGEVLERVYRDAIVRFCHGYLGDAAAAEDAAQEVFLKVLQADAVPDRFRPWLYRIARNHCLNLLRDRGRRGEDDLPSGSGLAEVRTGHLTRLVRAEQRARLERAVASLSRAQREVLELRYGEDLGRDEIAEVLDLPLSVVKSRLYEGMKRLRDRADDLGDGLEIKPR